MTKIYQTYESDFPNQVHQLNFSISQNYHLLKNGEIKYQSKKFDVNWKNYERSGKTHLVNFLIRDHFSNCFYAELHRIDMLPDMKEFLFNAWRRKEHFEFCGIPKHLILGRHIISRFSSIQNFAHNSGVNVELAENGFATGIRSLRDWDNNIKYYSAFYNYKTLLSFQENTHSICRDLNLQESGKTEPNLKKWAENQPQGFLINDKLEFDRLYEPTNKSS